MLTTFSDNVWKTYIFWAFWVGVTFFFVYPICNWLTSQRPHIFKLYFESELSVPFVPEFVWAYLSMSILFLMPPFFLGISGLKILGKQLVSATFFSGLIFLCFPVKLGVGRNAPEEPIYRSLFTSLKNKRIYWNDQFDFHLDQILERGYVVKVDEKAQIA